MKHNYHIYNIGDHALVVDGGDKIDPGIHSQMVQLAHFIQEKSLPGVKDLIVAYASLTIYYDPFPLKNHFQIQSTVFEWFSHWIQQTLQSLKTEHLSVGRKFNIPVCYGNDFGKDLEKVAVALQVVPQKIIEEHISMSYMIYMIGFIPGFPYMASLPTTLHTARKSVPETVPAGSVAIAGAQTGIYPVESPGGWNIIGRTPLSIFNKEAATPVFWQPGDEVQFHRISEAQFHQIAQNPSSWLLQ